MSADLSVKIDGINELQSAFRRAPEKIARNVNIAIKKSVFTLLANARKAAPVDQGFLRGAGMVTTFEDLTGTLKNTAPYAVYVHDGTKPHWPPLSAIEPWANRHGIPAFLVARSIARKGTKAKPFFKNSIEESQTAINAFFNKALLEFVNEL